MSDSVKMRPEQGAADLHADTQHGAISGYEARGLT